MIKKGRLNWNPAQRELRPPGVRLERNIWAEFNACVGEDHAKEPMKTGKETSRQGRKDTQRNDPENA